MKNIQARAVTYLGSEEKTTMHSMIFEKISFLILITFINLRLGISFREYFVLIIW